MTKHEKRLIEAQYLSHDEIMSFYELTQNDLTILSFLRSKEQCPKKDIIEYCYSIGLGTYKEIASMLGVLKKKDLIYSVRDLQGWLGTDMKI